MSGTLRWVAALLLFLGGGGASAALAQVSGARPNVVLILADDLGYGDLGCYGHPTFKTPRIDRMASEGVRLTHFYSPVPYCAPSRASLLTGRYPFRNGVTRNPAPDAGIDDVGIADSEITLGEAFQGAGYRTICIGKWHLGHRPEFHPQRHGFDEYLGILYSNDMRPVELMEGGAVAEYPVVQANLTRRYTERALAFIEQNRTTPFFLYLPHAMPHKPLAASEAFYKKTGAGLYGDVLAELDGSVGQILDKLSALDLATNTMVIFTSDNGPWYGGSTGGLRGMKGLTWEGGLRVPCIVRWPNRIPVDRVNAAPAIMMDLFATTLRAAGVALPGDRVIDGRDLWPVLTGASDSPHDALFSMKGPRIASVRSGPWKLHLRPPGESKEVSPGEKWIDPRAPDGVTILAPYEQSHPSDYPGARTGDPGAALSLFNLADDPAEQHNVAARHPDVVNRLKAKYEAVAREAGPVRE